MTAAASALAATSQYWDAQVAQFRATGVNTNRAEWLGHPFVEQHHRRLLGGSALDWLCERLPRGLRRGLGFGSGVSTFELDLLERGQVESFDLYDLSSAALEVARTNAARRGLGDRIRLRHDDVSHAFASQYDFVSCRSSLHHAVDMRATVTSIHHTLADGGVLFAQEYVGPNRFAYPEHHNAVVRSLYRALAEGLRGPWPDLPQPDPDEVARADPTESVESERLLPEVLAAFQQVELTELGGALPFMLWWGLDHDALWETAAGREFVALLLELDEALLRSGRLPSYFSVLVATK